MSDAYHTLAAFDDLAFAAMKISLSEPEQSIIVERLQKLDDRCRRHRAASAPTHRNTISRDASQTLLGIATRSIEFPVLNLFWHRF